MKMIQLNLCCVSDNNGNLESLMIFKTANDKNFDYCLGLLCETDIDECLSSPCVHGRCFNLLNSYSCQCWPGYRGTQCETQINECLEWTPCANNSTCVDLVADYSCRCATGYGGRNCSVLLTACSSSPCKNNGTCSAVLVDEILGIQNYSCSCPASYGGWLCNVSTVAGFKDNSAIVYSIENILSISLTFRTNQRYGLLAAASNFSLELLNSTDIIMKARECVLKVSAPQLLADSSWHTIVLRASNNETSLALLGENCSLPGMCIAKTFNCSLSNENKSTISIGGYSNSYGGFIGCMRDISINGVLLLPTENHVKSRNILSNCDRSDQCIVNRCEGQGKCHDIWWDYVCDCPSPLYGKTCNESKALYVWMK